VSQAYGYSVWLTPEGNEALPLKRLIADLSRSLHSSLFLPHVTLLGGVSRPQGSIIDDCRCLAAGMPSFRVHFTGVGWRDSYFRCLYLNVDPCPSLLRARATAVDTCGVVNDRLFLPHLSLAYGEFDEARKRVIACNVIHPYPPGFNVTHLDLVRTQGRPEDWRLIERFPLASEVMPLGGAR